MAHIDTLQKYKDLVASGMPEAQAEAHVQALNSSFDSVATKEDLNRVALATKEDFDRLAAMTKEDLNRTALMAKEDLKNAMNNLIVMLKAEFRLIAILGSAIFLTCGISVWQKLMV